MAGKAERDALTGVDTTGHEWDGIRELNNPLPRWWVYLFFATIAFSVLWWILYPSWPWSNGYLGGLLGNRQRVDLEERVTRARAEQVQWFDRIREADTTAIMADPELLQFAVAGGERHFKDNCAPCHGLGGAGQGYFPTLADDDWIWGGTLEQIELTIRHGIRNGQDAEARDSAMPAFGADGLLEPQQIEEVVQHVLALGQGTQDPAAEGGAAIYLENCASCHGEQGEGLVELGAPALNDAIWLYGGEPSQIRAQINRPRQGVMPYWQGRLDDETIKMLTVYVHSLGGGE